ncbi:MAG: 1,6-anhydro-N-acetylmuramyl-L-alanine amidase AmpD [Pseudomonadales bacterium]
MQWLDGVRVVESPKCEERPPGTEIDLLVLHNISLPPGQYGGEFVEQLFQNCLNPGVHPYFSEITDLRVSSHLYIKRDGAVIQFVPLDKRAWHAGDSEWLGRKNCNDFSIGVELEGCDDQEFTDAQYKALLTLTTQIRSVYPAITKDRIVGHSDIAPGRKTDPGPCFDWQRFLAEI